MGRTLPAQGKREAFLDLLRIAACFLVIVNHTANEVFLSRSPQERTWFLAVAWMFASKPAVLIFYMISGFLLLGRQDGWKKAWGRIQRILIVLLGCAVVYGIYQRQPLQVLLGVFSHSPSNQLWYLYMYLGILIMLPFLQKMAAAMDKKDYQIFFAIACVYTGLLPIAAHCSEALKPEWNFQMPLFSCAVAMLFAGNYFARFGVRRTKLGFLLAACLTAAAVLFGTWGTWLEYRRTEGSGYLFYDNRDLMPNMLAAVCLFYMAGFVKFSPRMSRAAAAVGGCTFGMYLMGDLLLGLMRPVWAALEGRLHVLPALLVYEVLIFACAFFLTALLRKIPWVRKLI